MTYMKVFATADEIEELKKPVPYMVFGTIENKQTGEFTPVTPETALQKCHRFALRHGLPEFDGYYGCDLRTGEFVKP